MCYHLSLVRDHSALLSFANIANVAHRWFVGFFLTWCSSQKCDMVVWVVATHGYVTIPCYSQTMVFVAPWLWPDWYSLLVSLYEYRYSETAQSQTASSGYIWYLRNHLDLSKMIAPCVPLTDIRLFPVASRESGICFTCLFLKVRILVLIHKD